MRAPELALDANASAPLLDDAREALAAALTVSGNPSSPHAAGRRARALVDDARAAVTRALGPPSGELVFTSGASEANRLVVDALVLRGRTRGAPPRVWSTTLEHPSLARPLAAAAARGDLDHTLLAVDVDGGIARPDGPAPDVLVVTAAHNETGLVPELGPLLAGLPASTLVVVDAAQAVARLPPGPARVDVVVASGHKMGAPPGVGAVLLRGPARALPSPWTGGGQEGGRRPGTEAVALLSAWGAAARVVEDQRAGHQALASLRDRLERLIVDGVAGARVVTRGPRLPQTTAVVVPDVDGDALRIALDRAGLLVGFGAACSALAPEPSPALVALGLTPREARATVRLSLPLGFAAPAVDEAAARFVAAVRDLGARDRLP